MTISSTIRVAGPFVGNDAVVNLDFDFKIFDDSEVQILSRLDSTGVDTELVLGADYTVALNTDQDTAPGGRVTLSNPLATGRTAFIVSEVSPLQESVFTNTGGFYPSVLNDALDRLHALHLENREVNSRAVVTPVGETGNLALPPVDNRVGKYLYFDVNGNIVASEGTDAGTAIAAVTADLASTASGKGAWLVKWISALSGAVARWVGDRLRDTVHITDFGAVGDGSTDDSTAFTNAIATGREIYIPAGTYTITPRTFSNMLSCKIRGAGRDVTKIVLSSTGTALTFSNCQWLQISDLSIQATGVAQSLANANGIQLDTGSSNCVIERVNFYGFSLDGLRLVGTSGSPLTGNVVRNCYFLGCGRYNLYSEYNADFTIDDNQFGSLGAYEAAIGCYLFHSSAGTYTKNKHWSNDIGLKAVSSNFNSYVDNRIEINNTQGAYFDTCTDLIFNSNRVYSNSVTTDGASDNLYFTGCARVVFVGNNIFTWNVSYSRWGVNFDTGCDELTVRSNIIRGFDSTNFGPIRFEGNIQRIDGDLVLHFTATSVAAGATVYPSGGAVTAEGAAYRSLHRRYAVGKLYAATVAAPGGGQTFTYTLRKNAADTSVTCTSSGGSSFAAAITTTAPQILLDSGDYVSPKLVTSAGAAVTDHRGYIVLVSY